MASGFANKGSASSDDENATNASATSSKTQSPNTVRDEHCRRMHYKEVLGFDPSQSWSSDYSVSSQEEKNQSKGKKRSKSKKRQFQRLTVEVDDRGRYVFSDSKKMIPPSVLSKSSETISEEKLAQWKQERMKDSRDLECTICLDTVLQDKHIFDRKFGLLPNCSHIFCLECSIKWKEKCEEEGCPVCHEPIDQILPCRFFVKCKRQKQRMLAIMIGRAREKNAQLRMLQAAKNFRKEDFFEHSDYSYDWE